MKHIYQTFILLFAILLSDFGYSQTTRRVQGMLRDSLSRVVAGASVQLITKDDSIGTSSNKAGIFVFDNVKGKEFTLRVSSIGYELYEKDFVFPKGEDRMSIPSFVLKSIPNILDEVIVDGVLTVQARGDTIEYATKHLKLRDDALVEDAVKKLEGVEVDKDGNITAQGEEVTRVKVNGKEFFGGDVKTATKNLPADIIEKMQIVDDYGDKADLTGDKSGDSEKILNIIIDEDRNKGYTSTLRTGYGTDDRYQVTGSYMGMKEGVQFSVLGNLNNINAPLFDFNTTGGGARRGRGGRGGGMFGARDGLVNAASVGVNYRQDFSEDLMVYGSYSFGRDDNDILKSSQDLYDNNNPDSVLFKTSGETTNSIGNSHRLEANVEWSLSEKDYIKFSPQFSFGKTRTNVFSDFTNTLGDVEYNSEDNQSYSVSSAPRVGLSGLYNRKLSEEGRNLFFNMNWNSSANKQDQDRVLESMISDPNNADQDVNTIYRKTISEMDNKSWNGGASLSYLEPVSEFGKVEVSYNYNVNTYDNNRAQSAFDEDGAPILEDQYNYERMYDYSFQTHRLGVNYNYNSEKIKYSLGASVQPNLLQGDALVDGNPIDIHRKGLNFVPIARFEYQFSRQKNIRINYSGSSNEPSITQIQPFTDNSNPTSIVTGNPDLNAEFNHNLRLRFSNSDFQKGRTFFLMFRGSLAQDKIVSNMVQNRDPELGVVQETNYLNASGTYNLRSFYHYGKSFKDKTYNIMVMGGASYNNNVAFSDSYKNVAQNWVLNQGLSFRYNPSENLEISPGVRYMWNHTVNTLTERKLITSSLSPTLYGSVNLSPTWIFGYDLSKAFYTGSGFDDNPFIINAYIEKKMLKSNQGTIRVAAFDVLDEQINIARTNVEALNLVSDTRTNRLGQYFMVTLTYKLSKFAGGVNPADGDRSGPRGRRR